MIIKDHTRDQVRLNHLGIIMSLLDNKNNYFSYISNFKLLAELNQCIFDSSNGLFDNKVEYFR